MLHCLNFNVVEPKRHQNVFKDAIELIFDEFNLQGARHQLLLARCFYFTGAKLHPGVSQMH